METTDYVSYPLALALKKAGFDWPCTSFYRNLDKELWEGGEMNWNNGVDYSAPTLWQAQKWLREKWGLHVYVKFYLSPANERGEKKVRWYYLVQRLKNESYRFVDEDDYFDSYEKALLNGIEFTMEGVYLDYLWQNKNKNG